MQKRTKHNVEKTKEETRHDDDDLDEKKKHDDGCDTRTTISSE